MTDRSTLALPDPGTDFPRTLRALASDGLRRSVLASAALLLGAWLAWFFLARITVHEVSEEARLEVDHATSPVDAQVAGHLVVNHMVLGRQVAAGDVLAELDSTMERRRLELEQLALTALGRQSEAIRRELQALARALEAEGAAARSNEAAALARNEEAGASARLAALTATRLGTLEGTGYIPDLDLQGARAEAQRSAAAASARRQDVARLRNEQLGHAARVEASMAALSRQLAVIEERQATTRVAVAVLEQAIEQRQVRAPVDGRIAELGAATIGTFLRAGDRLGAVEPPGGLQIVAGLPAAALGRVHPGQPADLRLHGFRWTNYGVVHAEVSRVASDVRDGRVRVELRLTGPAPNHMTLQHGLPGTLEIAVEAISPAALVLRQAGVWLSSTGEATP